jgi:hypothetical protein
MPWCDRARISPGDAVPHGADPAELLDIDMDELARVLALITPDWFGRLQGTQLAHLKSLRGFPLRPGLRRYDSYDP